MPHSGTPLPEFVLTIRKVISVTDKAGHRPVYFDKRQLVEVFHNTVHLWHAQKLTFLLTNMF